MTYYVIGYNVHPTKGHNTTIQKTMNTNCEETAISIARVWKVLGLNVETYSEG